MRLFLLLLVASIVGCAAQRAKEGYYQSTIVQSWVGEPAQKLWDAWGPPTQTMTAPNGGAVYVYETAKIVRSTSSSTYVGYGLAVGGGQATTINCESFFNVDPETKIITSADWRGGNCEALSPEEKEQRDQDVMDVF